MQERLGISDERVYMQTGINRRNKDMSHIDAKFAGASGGGTAPATGEAQAATAPAAVAAAPPPEKTAFDLKLTVVDAKVKIKVIKEVRTITGLGLKEAKDLVEKAPVVIKQGLKKEDVENFKKILIDAGAQVEVL